MDFDILIIGGGVTGASIARELSKYTAKIGVIEQNSDVCEGTSKANSGIVHGGFDATPGSLKARLNVAGAKAMAALSEELDFPYKNNGSMVISISEEGVKGLKELKEKGEANGVSGLEIISGDEARTLEPNLSDDVVAALHIPSSGIVCPFNITIALSENAVANGVKFMLETKVIGITAPSKKERESDNDGIFRVETDKGVFTSRIVINAAGVYGDEIHNMVSETKEKLIARRGEYCLYDKRQGDFVSHTIFQLPTNLGKGILVTPTVHGNMMVGPNAFDIEDKEGTNTSKAGLDEVLLKAEMSVKALPARKNIITSFAGLRAHSPKGDFIIEEVKDCKNFIDVIGIESPGLSCAPAVGPFVADIVKRCIPLEKKAEGQWIAKRKGFLNPNEMAIEDRARLIEENSSYGNIICRCEGVSEGEMIDAIRRPLGATSLDGIKRRVRGGSGRCQGGFCAPKVMDIIAREKNIAIENVNKSGKESKLIFGELRKEAGHENN